MGSKKLHPEGLLGVKLGMTHVFGEQGECVPVTAIRTGPCYILDVKTGDKHGYDAVQLGFEPKKLQRINKADKGRFAKSGVGSFYHVRELRCDPATLGWTKTGTEIKVGQVFQTGELVDISGMSKGRGFAGVFKRHHMSGQPFTRGTHEYRRHVGSVGCRKFPGRIHPNKRMPGRMGNERVTVQNLEVVGVRAEDNVILIKGGIPGAKGQLVLIRRAVKGYAPRQQAVAASA